MTKLSIDLRLLVVAVSCGLSAGCGGGAAPPDPQFVSWCQAGAANCCGEPLCAPHCDRSACGCLASGCAAGTCDSSSRLCVYSVSVTALGTGGGRVVSSPAGLDCQPPCAANFEVSSTVTLSGTPDGTSYLVGFSGDCAVAGAGSCALTMNADKAVMVQFDPLTGDPLWSDGYGGAGWDWVWGVAADMLGNVYVTGEFEASANFGGLTFTTTAPTDAFFAAYSGVDGRHLWSRALGTSGQSTGYGIAVAADGDVVVTGAFSGQFSARFAGGSTLVRSAGGADAFVGKLSAADGAMLWGHSMGGTGIDYAYPVEVDPVLDEAYVVGAFDGTVALPTGALTSAGGADIFVAKYSTTDGALLDAWSFGTANDEMPGLNAALDSAGSLLLAYSARSGTGTEGFVAKYAQLSRLWLRPLQAAVATGVAAGAEDDVVVTGFFSAVADLGTGAIPPVGGLDAFVAKYAGADGGHLWSRTFGAATRSTRGSAVAIASSGAIVATGDFDGSIDFGGGSVVPAGGSDVFVTKLSPLGEHLWSRGFGGSFSEGGIDVAIDGADRCIVAGLYAGQPDFGPGPLGAFGGFDVFWMRMNP